MPKDNEVDEKVMPVAWIVTNGGESCEPWLEYEQSEVDALPAVCIAEPLYSAATVAELRAEVERQSEQMEIVYRYLQKVAPWSESNDMLWCDEVVCGIDSLMQRIAELEADSARYRWLRDGKLVAPKGDYPVAKSYRHGTTLWGETLDGLIDSILTGADPT